MASHIRVQWSKFLRLNRQLLTDAHSNIILQFLNFETNLKYFAERLVGDEKTSRINHDILERRIQRVTHSYSWSDKFDVIIPVFIWEFIVDVRMF